MIDAIKAVSDDRSIIDRLSLTEPYCVVTLHRPQNVDDEANLEECLKILNKVQTRTKVVYVHK